MKTEPAFRGDISTFRTFKEAIDKAVTQATSDLTEMNTPRLSYGEEQKSDDITIITTAAETLSGALAAFIDSHDELATLLNDAIGELEDIKADSDTNWAALETNESQQATANTTAVDNSDTLETEWTDLRTSEDDVYRNLATDFNQFELGAAVVVEQETLDRMTAEGITTLESSDHPEAVAWAEHLVASSVRTETVSENGDDGDDELAQLDELIASGVDADDAAEVIDKPDDVVEAVIDGKIDIHVAEDIAELTVPERANVINSDIDDALLTSVLDGFYGDEAREALLSGHEHRLNKFLLLDPETQAVVNIDEVSHIVFDGDDKRNHEDLGDQISGNEQEIIAFYEAQGMEPDEAAAAFADLQDSHVFLGESEAASRRVGEFSAAAFEERALTLLNESNADSAQGLRLNVYEGIVERTQPRSDDSDDYPLNFDNIRPEDQLAVTELILDRNIEIVESSPPDSMETTWAMNRINELIDETENNQEIRADVADLLVERGLEVKAEADPTVDGDTDRRHSLATLLTHQGIQLMDPDEERELVARLEHEFSTRSDMSTVSGLDLLVEALDVGGESSKPPPSGWGQDPENHVKWRGESLNQLLEAVIDEDGLLTEGGTALVDSIALNVPEDAIHVDTEDLELLDPTGDHEVPEFSLRHTLGLAMTADNYGIEEDNYEIAVLLDELNAEYLETDDPAEIQRLADEHDRIAAGLDLTDEELEQFNVYLSAGLTPSAAIRTVRGPYDKHVRDARSDMMRAVLGVGVDDDGKPRTLIEESEFAPEMAEAVIKELLLESIAVDKQRVAEFREANPVDAPLTEDEQVALSYLGELVAEAPENGLSYESLEEMAENGDERARYVLDHPDVLAMTFGASENEDFFGTVDADGNPVFDYGDENLDQFMEGTVYHGADGRRQTAVHHNITIDDISAVNNQIVLLETLTPYAKEIDVARYGGDLDQVYADEDFQRWLNDNPDLPPALKDSIHVALQSDYIEDPFSRDEVGEIAGYTALVLGVAATLVPSGGTSTLLLAGAAAAGIIEVGIQLSGGNTALATLAAIGVFFDLGDATKLALRLGISVHAAQSLIDSRRINTLAETPNLTIAERAELDQLLAASPTIKVTPADIETAQRTMSPEQLEQWMHTNVYAKARAETVARLQEEGVPLNQINELADEIYPARLFPAEGVDAGRIIEPPPAGAPDSVIGRVEGDPPGVYRYGDGAVAVVDPKTGRWTVPQALGKSKGSFGEVMGQHNLTEQGHTPLLHGDPSNPSRVPGVDLGDPTNAPGIDQLYINADPPPSLIVAEPKYRSGEPFVTDPNHRDWPTTNDGVRQLSPEWIEGHAEILLDSGLIDTDTYRALVNGDYQAVIQRVDPAGNVENVEIPKSAFDE